MKHLFRSLLPLAVLALTAHAPALAQATAGYAFASGGQGNQNNVSGLATGSQAYQNSSMAGNTNIGRMGSYGGGLQGTYYASQAPYSVNNAALPSGHFSYGFNSGVSTLINQIGNSATGGQAMPITSTSSNDLNVCDLPYLRLGSGNNEASITINTPIGNTSLPTVINAGQALQGLNSLFGN